MRGCSQLLWLGEAEATAAVSVGALLLEPPGKMALTVCPPRVSVIIRTPLPLGDERLCRCKPMRFTVTLA